MSLLSTLGGFLGGSLLGGKGGGGEGNSVSPIQLRQLQIAEQLLGETAPVRAGLINRANAFLGATGTVPTPPPDLTAPTTATASTITGNAFIDAAIQAVNQLQTDPNKALTGFVGGGGLGGVQTPGGPQLPPGLPPAVVPEQPPPPPGSGGGGPPLPSSVVSPQQIMSNLLNNPQISGSQALQLIESMGDINNFQLSGQNQQILNSLVSASQAGGLIPSSDVLGLINEINNPLPPAPSNIDLTQNLGSIPGSEALSFIESISPIDQLSNIPNLDLILDAATHGRTVAAFRVADAINAIDPSITIQLPNNIVIGGDFPKNTHQKPIDVGGIATPDAKVKESFIDDALQAIAQKQSGAASLAQQIIDLQNPIEFGGNVDQNRVSIPVTVLDAANQLVNTQNSGAVNSLAQKIIELQRPVSVGGNVSPDRVSVPTTVLEAANQVVNAENAGAGNSFIDAALAGTTGNSFIDAALAGTTENSFIEDAIAGRTSFVDAALQAIQDNLALGPLNVVTTDVSPRAGIPISVADIPQFRDLKNTIENQFRIARDRTRSQLPGGGSLASALTGLEGQRATALASGMAQLTENELARAMAIATGTVPVAMNTFSNAALANAQIQSARDAADAQAKAGLGGALGTLGGAIIGKG